MWRWLLLLITVQACAAATEVEVRANEVWVIREGGARQLTNDGRSKFQAVLSPSSTRIAYYEVCPVTENCTPSVIILNLEGKRLQAFHAMAEGWPCLSILPISWQVENSIATECHINPSVSEYIETDLRTEKTTADLLGLDFSPSPDRKHIAHSGQIMHFAPPFAQSDYLCIDKTAVYPLPRGGKPSTEKPDVVRKDGST